MKPLTAAQLLNVWERGTGRDVLERAELLLRAAHDSEQDEDPCTLTLGERDARLLKLREWIFGTEISAVTHCPKCREELELRCLVSELAVNAGKVEPQLSLCTDGYEIKFRVPTTADLAAARSLQTSLEDTEKTLLARCIFEASHDGQMVAVETLPDSVIESLSAGMAAADPQAEIEFNLKCNACKSEWSELFEVEKFLWSEIQSWATRVLNEVHQLAAAYGWSESEILGMSSVRRSAYLNLIAG